MHILSFFLLDGNVRKSHGETIMWKNSWVFNGWVPEMPFVSPLLLSNFLFHGMAARKLFGYFLYKIGKDLSQCFFFTDQEKTKLI